MNWPTEPRADGTAPPVMELLAAKDRVALHAKTLITMSANLKK